MFWGPTQPDGMTLLGDAVNAYLKSELPGPEETWLCLDRAMRPSSHARYRTPVIRLRRALYGQWLVQLGARRCSMF